MKPTLIISAIAAILAAAGIVFVVVRPEPAGFTIESPKEKIPVAKEELLASERYFDLRGKEEVLISIVDFFFQPQKIVIDAGTEIFWKNEDPAAHTVKSGDHPMLNSQPLGEGDLFAVTLTEPGIYYYYCGNHPDKMGGLIIVELWL